MQPTCISLVGLVGKLYVESNTLSLHCVQLTTEKNVTVPDSLEGQIMIHLYFGLKTNFLLVLKLVLWQNLAANSARSFCWYSRLGGIYQIGGRCSWSKGV